MIIDTHIHLSHHLYNNVFPFLSFEADEYIFKSGTREEMMKQIRKAGVIACIDPGIDIESNQRLLCLANQFPTFVFPAVGIHPTRTFRYRKIDHNGNKINVKLHWNQRNLIRKYAENPHVVAIGETGLDYHFD